MVLADEIHVKAGVGSTIWGAIAECIKTAKIYHCVVYLTFNDKQILITSEDDVDIKAREFFEKSA